MFPANTKILIVDDFITMRKILRKVLVDLGFSNIEEASDGVHGLQKMTTAIEKNEPFQLVFSDWNMPNLSGIDFLSACRNHADAQMRAPFLMIAAESEKCEVEEKLPLETNDYLIKPFNIRSIQQKIESLASRNRIVAPVPPAQVA